MTMVQAPPEPAMQWSIEHDQRLRLYLATHRLTRGLGEGTGTCSLGTINLVVSDTITDTSPDCMSPTIGS